MTDPLDRLLYDSGPEIDLGPISGPAELAAEVRARTRRPLLRTARRKLAAAAVVGAVLVPGAAVAATHFAAETGRFGSPGKTENDTSQYIDMCASDIDQYVATLQPRRSLPAGTTWADVRARMLAGDGRDCPPRGPGLVEQVTGIKVLYLQDAECPWEKDFLGAHRRGDDAEQHRAAGQIAGLEDATQAIGGFGDDNWKAFRDHAAAGNWDWIAWDYQVNCLGMRHPTVPDPQP